MAEPVSRKRPGCRGSSPSTGPLDGEDQIGLALHLVDRHPGRAAHEVVRRNRGPFSRREVVQGEIETVRGANRRGLGLDQRALTGLPRTHQHDDRRDLHRLGHEPRRMSGQIRTIVHRVDDYRSRRGRSANFLYRRISGKGLQTKQPEWGQVSVGPCA